MPCTWHHFNTRESFMGFGEISNFYRQMSNCHAIRASKLFSLFWWNEIKFSKKVEMEVYLKHLETTIDWLKCMQLESFWWALSTTLTKTLSLTRIYDLHLMIDLFMKHILKTIKTKSMIWYLPIAHISNLC